MLLTLSWTEEPESLPFEEPLFAAALRTEESIFVEDVETASPKVVNLAFEQKHFGHRALIHAHLCFDNLLWGILQPCVFGEPRVWTELTQNARYRGRWVAMLISMHTSELNEGKRGESAELNSFLDEQLEHQKQWRQELKISKEEADKAYAFFQWCDRLSLILCQRELPAGERALEISIGPDGKRYDVMQRSDESVSVEPWPFESEKFTVNVEACYLNQVKFDSSAALTKALQTAPLKVLQWTLAK